jgi:hypothetical protein
MFGIGFGIWNRRRIAPLGLTCLASIPLSSGVAASVSVPSGDKWLRFVGSQSGGRVLTIASTTGSPDVTIYYGTCDSLTQLTTFTGNSTYTTLVLGAGVVVYVKITGTAATATVTAAMWAPNNLTTAPYVFIDPLASGAAFTDDGTTPAAIGDKVYRLDPLLYGSTFGAGRKVIQPTLAARPTLRSDGLEFPLAANLGIMNFVTSAGANATASMSTAWTIYTVGTRSTGEQFIPWGMSSSNFYMLGQSANTWKIRLNTQTPFDGTPSVDTGLFCARLRLSTTLKLKTTGISEADSGAGGGTFTSNRFGANDRTGLEFWNTATTTRYRGLIMLKADVVNVSVNGTTESSLLEAWIASNWGVGP